MTYIKLDDVLSTLKRVGDEQKRPDLYAMIGFIIGMFERTPKYELPEQQPTVVRCNECICWDKHIEECGNPDSVCFHNGWCKPNWFCADGKRR